jgi:hypothetical protein
MKKNIAKKTETRLSEPVKVNTEKPMVLPPGVKFSDIYMDAPQVAQELNLSKRTVRNIRVSGKLSYTNPFGKIWYFRQEIAAILEAGKTPKKK